MTKTISISVNDNDIKDIDTYCTMHSLTRSKFFVQSALEKVQVEHVANSMIFICGMLDRGEMNGVLNEEDEKMLHDIVKYWAETGKSKNEQ